MDSRVPSLKSILIRSVVHQDTGITLVMFWGNHSGFCSLLLRLNHAWMDASDRNMALIWKTANLKGNRESGCPERGLKIVQC